LNRGEGSIFPCAINSSNTGLFFNNTIMMNNEIIGNKIIPRNEGFICRKFIQPYNNTPNLLRYYYWDVGYFILPKIADNWRKTTAIRWWMSKKWQRICSKRNIDWSNNIWLTVKKKILLLEQLSEERLWQRVRIWLSPWYSILKRGLTSKSVRLSWIS